MDEFVDIDLDDCALDGSNANGRIYSFTYRSVVNRVLYTDHLTNTIHWTAPPQNPTPEQKKEIELKSYYLWQEAGMPEGRDQEFYYKAEREVMDQLTFSFSDNLFDHSASTFTDIGYFYAPYVPMFTETRNINRFV